MMRVLDLFCGAGGASMGYHRAWPDAEIVGVDILPQPDYPFTFVQGDALNPPVRLEEFDFIHASPPCQGYTSQTAQHENRKPRLIKQVRALIERSGARGIIENVEGAKAEMDSFIRLSGGMFDLGIHRPRIFEPIGWWLFAPPMPAGRYSECSIVGSPNGRRLYKRPGKPTFAWSSVEQGQRLLGIEWTDDWHQLREAIPPAYTQWIGEQLG